MRKHLVKLLSAVLFINFLIFNVFYRSSIVYAKDGISSYTVSATFGQTLGRKHAEHVNEFRRYSGVLQHDTEFMTASFSRCILLNIFTKKWQCNLCYAIRL